jgi:hypothetical protein
MPLRLGQGQFRVCPGEAAKVGLKSLIGRLQLALEKVCTSAPKFSGGPGFHTSGFVENIEPLYRESPAKRVRIG